MYNWLTIIIVLIIVIFGFCYFYVEYCKKVRGYFWDDSFEDNPHLFHRMMFPYQYHPTYGSVHKNKYRWQIDPSYTAGNRHMGHIIHKEIPSGTIASSMNEGFHGCGCIRCIKYHKNPALFHSSSPLHDKDTHFYDWKVDPSYHVGSRPMSQIQHFRKLQHYC